MSEAFEHLETKTSLSFLESVKAIVQNKILLMRMLNIFYQWFCGAIGYQGTLYIATKLSGDPHFNFAMTMIPAIPGTFVYLLLPDRIGRRYTLILCEVILGICCIVAAFIRKNESLVILQITISMIIRFISGVSIKVILNMVAELFPTPIRSTIMGIGGMVAGVGAFAGLMIESLAVLVWDPLPLLIIGFLVIIASGLSFLIPETKGKALPETIEDALSIR